MTPLLREALKAITGRTNLSTGLTHPNDMNAAKEMFLRLHKAGEILLANEIEDYAVSNGWREKDAEELGQLGAQIGMGKKVRVEGTWWKEEILEILQAWADGKDLQNEGSAG